MIIQVAMMLSGLCGFTAGAWVQVQGPTFSRTRRGGAVFLGARDPLKAVDGVVFGCGDGWSYMDLIHTLCMHKAALFLSSLTHVASTSKLPCVGSFSADMWGARCGFNRETQPRMHKV